MKKEMADKWIAALRSGKYRQGKGCLRDESDKYCCLGVACEVAGFEAKKNFEDDCWSFKGNTFLLGSDDLRKKVGIRHESGHLTLQLDEIVYLKSKYELLRVHEAPTWCTNLSVLNDSGISFDDIADIIEKHWEEL